MYLKTLGGEIKGLVVTGMQPRFEALPLPASLSIKNCISFFRQVLGQGEKYSPEELSQKIGRCSQTYVVYGCILDTQMIVSFLY